jgi:RNA-directed DNA polymerase
MSNHTAQWHYDTKQWVRRLTNRSWRVSWTERITRLTQYLNGWKAYFGFAEATSEFKELDGWIRRRLRCVLWKQWKTYRCRKRELVRRGVRPELAHTTAWSGKGLWQICHTPGVRLALPNSYFDSIGLPRLAR